MTPDHLAFHQGRRVKIGIGSFYADSTRFTTTTGWRPRVGLAEGLATTVAFYRDHLHTYADAAETAVETV